MKEKIKKKLIEYKPYIALSVIGLVLLVAAYEYYHRYIYIFRDPDKIRYIITSYGKYGVSVFLLIQILQVIAFLYQGRSFRCQVDIYMALCLEAYCPL